MNLKPTTIKELQEILQRDYNTVIPNDDAKDFGASLLRLSKLVSIALARAGEDISPSQAREDNSLEIAP